MWRYGNGVGADAEFSRLKAVLGSNIRRLRHQAAQSQEEAAFVLRVAVRHLQKLESGEVNVTLKTLAKVCVAYRVSPAQLFAACSEPQ